MMVKKKKRVPDWLNNPIWSSPSITRSSSPPQSPKSSSYDDRTVTVTNTNKSSSVTSSDSSDRFVPVPQPKVRVSSVSSDENDVVGEDVTRQALLLQEVRLCVVWFLEFG
ncbi:ypt/Rab-GAP domain of gyp1p superfamily protein [Artemisia annua]|uniref:Ypt/Rab-GAP domain of gyp1p superfamily protein n=1 Tax=Artemisia annua TaxID=35608 RepID=A0A2U1L4Q2_ARTAN|nr:ypt/Rab-GAP domain of gyp1p superfamily protein [Artemisia annua]